MKYFVEPWDHQKKAIELSLEKKDMALFWEMGTGKTATTINILRHKFQARGRVMKTLILCPVVVLENWKEEILRHSDTNPNLIVVLRGTGQQKVKQIMDSVIHNRIIIGNYEIMQNEAVLEALHKFHPEIMVCDESQRCKSPTSKRAKAIAFLAEKCQHRYILSGTPILNSPLDIFQQYKILDSGSTFGKNFFAFRNMFFFDKNAGMPKQRHFPLWLPKPGAMQKLSNLIASKGLRTTKEECLDLPPLVREVRKIEMSAEQKRAYKEMRDDYVTYIKDIKDNGKEKASVADLAITKGLRLQQIASGFCNTDDGSTISFANTPRAAELRELLEELTPNHKVIVWACFKENYKQIAHICSDLKIEYAELHGEIKNKEAEINRFRNDDKCRVIICNQLSAGIGVNLVQASYSIYFSKNFSLEQDVQSEARNHRGGSEMHQKITRIDLVAGETIDEHLTEALAKKQNIAEAILDWDL